MKMAPKSSTGSAQQYRPLHRHHQQRGGRRMRAPCSAVASTGSSAVAAVVLRRPAVQSSGRGSPPHHHNSCDIVVTIVSESKEIIWLCISQMRKWIGKSINITLHKRVLKNLGRQFFWGVDAMLTFCPAYTAQHFSTSVGAHLNPQTGLVKKCLFMQAQLFLDPDADDDKLDIVY